MLQKFIVSRDDNIYQAWPDVVLTKSNKLICVFTECKHHGDRDKSRIMICESYDRGRTWTNKKPLTDNNCTKEHYYNCARISRLSDDSLVIIVDKNYHFGSDECGEGSRMQLWHGDSEGKNWGEPIFLPEKIRGIVPGKFQELSNGRYIITAHYKADSEKAVQYLWYSDDKGKTWSDEIVVGKDERYNLCEGSLLELHDGTLVMYMRENSSRGYDCMKSISHDMGETWEGVYNVPIPACHRPVAGFLKSGKIMITHRFCQGGRGWLGSWTQNTFAAFLSEEYAARTDRRESARIFPLDFDRSTVSDCGYTGWAQFDDGEIYVVNYIVDDAPQAHIRGYSFYESDVFLPTDTENN